MIEKKDLINALENISNGLNCPTVNNPNDVLADLDKFLEYLELSSSFSKVISYLKDSVKKCD